LGEAVLDALPLPRLSVWRRCQQALSRQLLEPLAEDRPAAADVLRELIEASHAIEGLAQDREGPLFAADIQRATDRAACGAVVVAGQEQRAASLPEFDNRPQGC